MIYFRKVILRELRANSSEEQLEKNTKKVHFKINIVKKKDAYVEEEVDGSKYGE